MAKISRPVWENLEQFPECPFIRYFLFIRPDYFFLVLLLPSSDPEPALSPLRELEKCCLWRDIPFGRGGRNNSNSKQI